METEANYSNKCLTDQYLKEAISILGCNFDDETTADFSTLETVKEPFFSKKLSVLIEVLTRYRLQEGMKCIIFVKRTIIARTLAYILGNMKSLSFWKCEFLVGYHSGLKNMSRKKMNAVVEKFCSGEVNLLVATNVAEEGLDIQTCCLVVRFDLPQTVASFIQSRGRARMMKSKYIFLVERGNQQDEKLLDDFIIGETIMSKEVLDRSSDDTFNNLEEIIYKVTSTGASISTGCSVSLLHYYCSKLPRDMYFAPSLKFFYIDDSNGIICRMILPPNAPFRQVESLPCASKDEAKRNACLQACKELHEKGALTDYLLPGLSSGKKNGSTAHHSGCNSNEDENLRELYEMLVPSVLKASRSNFDSQINMYFYYIRLVPIPEDRQYRMFGLFVMSPLPKEAEKLEVDLHLAHGRIVEAGIEPKGMLTFCKEEIVLGQYFQEMCLKIILDRAEFYCDHVSLGKFHASEHCFSTFYLLLPVKQQNCGDKIIVDWETIRCCLSSPVFGRITDLDWKDPYPISDSLKLLNGTVSKHNVLNSLVFTPHNKLFFLIDDVIHGTNANSQYKSVSYAQHYQDRFNIQLSHPEQPLLKAKPLFNLHNLLHNRLQGNTESHELLEHFVELPPELCCLKIVGFSKDIGSSLSLLPSLMHRLENLLVAIELKEVLASSFPEASEIRADCILEALTTEKCLERLSLERFEVLGDAFLKYAVGRHCFVSFQGLDEGQLTRMRSAIVNNSNLCELAIKKNLQVYIRDQPFDPTLFFALGRPCNVVCNADTESSIHQMGTDSGSDRPESGSVRCTKSHNWLHRKTIADVVEALVGAFLVESGFKAAFAFLRWLGIPVHFDLPDVYRVYKSSNNNLSLCDVISVAKLEELIGYTFKYKGLILQALVHASYSNHPGGCYQKLEFLGDAVLEYLITSYLYSAYPDLKPGQITDLRSISVNNYSFAHIAVWNSLHKFLVKDSNSLTEAVNQFEKYVQLSEPEKDMLEEPACPKVLGDIVESCVGAVLLDTGFDLNQVWKLMLMLLGPVLNFTSLQLHAVRELREFCESSGLPLGLPDPVKEKGLYFVKVEVGLKDHTLTCMATNKNSKAARKMAAQEALSKLKAHGYKPKRKSLEEVLRTTRKNEAKLIGFDEDPILVENDNDICIKLEKLSTHEPEESSLFLQDAKSAGTSFGYKSFIPSGTEENCMAGVNENYNGTKCKHEPVIQHYVVSSGLAEKSNPWQNSDMETLTSLGDLDRKPAKSRLLEICTANYWDPPLFECCKDEGPSHLREFTYKVTVRVEGATAALLECFSDPKAQKKAAQEHAAEGALWYLKQQGYLP
ncbi:endoribonuclease Dicer homolog 4 isoform X1 [Ananas comosus]|uniref:Endoribonuclease Dicer homolog 4 isoform X1 n=1 Tax=Ananas comosus TaxID=4615 RepID=A0A6P5GUW2_ANACO|nr:endoribonuclease Dicer homolog 4 isoform X1 [Ananas comosus]